MPPARLTDSFPWTAQHDPLDLGAGEAAVRALDQQIPLKLRDGVGWT